MVRRVRQAFWLLVGACIISAAVAPLTDNAYFLLPVLLLAMTGPVARLAEWVYSGVIAPFWRTPETSRSGDLAADPPRSRRSDLQLDHLSVRSGRIWDGSTAMSLLGHVALLLLGTATLTGVVLRGGDGTHPTTVILVAGSALVLIGLWPLFLALEHWSGRRSIRRSADRNDRGQHHHL